MTRTDQPATTESTPDSDLASPSINAERLLQLITNEYESPPRQLKRIASYMSQQSDRIMVDRISDIARECEVHPSAIVRLFPAFSPACMRAQRNAGAVPRGLYPQDHAGSESTSSAFAA